LTHVQVPRYLIQTMNVANTRGKVLSLFLNVLALCYGSGPKEFYLALPYLVARSVTHSVPANAIEVAQAHPLSRIFSPQSFRCRDTMAADEFNLFPFLALELREMIWEHAVRPAVPGAHVFPVLRRPDPSTQDALTKSQQLAAPRFVRNGMESRSTASTLTNAAVSPFSWPLDNPSAYLIDSGLWTACKESRRVLKRELMRKERRQMASSSSDQGSLNGQGAVTVPGPATFRTIDAHLVTVFVNQDLFIIADVFSGAQPSPPRNEDLVSETMTRWPHIQHAAPISHSVAAAVSQLSRCGLSQPGSRNFAVEYNPSWDAPWYDPAGAISTVVHTLRSHLRGASFKLWFINYHIRPSLNNSHPPTGDDDDDNAPRVFYAADRRFIEVKESPTGHGVISAPWYVARSAKTIYRTENQMDSLAALRCMWRYFSPMGRIPIEFGLLACEYL